MKLHLGCYRRKIHGYVNVDIRADVSPDLVDDVFKLESVKPNSVEVIYISHVLEHADRAESMVAMKRWYDLLEPNGVLRISVPDLQAIFEHYIYHHDLRLLQNLLYGSQKHDYDYHYTGWDFTTLKEDLESIGFGDVRRWDHTKVEHFYCDDYSQAYLPHLDRVHGRLMSLNVEATKLYNA